MQRAVLAGLGLAFLLVAGPSANAQWYGGWGGWGGGAGTAYGDIARGMGVFAAGVGQMNLADAQAESINATTRMRWNDYEWQINQSLYRDYNARLIKQQRDTARSVDEIQKRLRENPTAVDIQGGRALNAILDDFQNPRVQEAARRVSEPRMISSNLIKRIPFFYSSDPFTFSLNQFMSGKVEVPEALKAPEFEADRKKIRELAQKAREEDEESEAADVTEETFRELNAATRALRAKFEAKFPPNSKEYVDTEPFLKALVGFTTLLKSNDFEKELQKLEDNKQVSLFKLLTFMTIYNLRFGRADSPEQRAVYNQLYPIMDERRREIAALIAQSAPPAENTAPDAPPTHIFQDLNFDQLHKTTTAPQPPTPKFPAPK
ncbi:MAG: hypothetical protein U0800_18470 [Isosphaeraceae bacterium]